MATLPRIKGVHRIRRTLASGPRVDHYTARGGVRFWREPEDGADPVAYVKAYEVAKKSRPVTPRSSIDNLVTGFLASGEFARLADRTRADYRLWADRFRERFGAAPAALLEDRRFRGDVAAWRDQWAHSPKQAQYAWTVAKRVASWGMDRGVIGQHVITGGSAIYKADRAEMVWTAADVDGLCAVAPRWVRRIIITAVSTGLRVGDLCRLSRSHLVDGAIQMRTAKRSRIASIPILPEMRGILDETPADRLLILVSERGRPLTPHRASEGVRQWAAKARINPDLRLADARGTAATRLVRAGVAFDRVAACMGWSLRHAQEVVSHYVSIDPAGAAEVASILERERNAKL